MAVRCVVGLQWGDEGKGRVIDLMTDVVDIVARYQGGNNAGHTVVIEDNTFKLHLIPTGILRPGKKSVICNGVIVDPAALLEEIAQLEAAGLDVSSNLLVSDRAHVVMPYHKAIEAVSEEIRSGAKNDTTGRGISPCYADKASYNGIRICDLYDEELFRRQVRTNLALKNPVLKQWSSGGEMSEDAIVEEYLGYAQQIRPYVCDTIAYLNQAIDAGKRVLFEGAQGSMLDVDFGTYPYVTGSNATVCGIPAGAGIAPRNVEEVLGVLKPYTTRVGAGPFPTELTDATGDKLRERGKEYGATTGRPRRCGWLDAVAVRYAMKLSGVDRIALTNLDVLSTFEKIGVATAYTAQGQAQEHFPAAPAQLASCEAQMKWFDGWTEEITEIRAYDRLPTNARVFVEAVEQMLCVPIQTVSVGPERSQVIHREG